MGYWKTHPELITQYLPIALGDMTVTGTKATLVTSSDQALKLLQKTDSSNGLEKLQAQLLAAKLSIAHGASASAVADTITASDDMLTTWSTGQWKRMSALDQQLVLELMSTLDRYNNGLIGPGHCL